MLNGTTVFLASLGYVGFLFAVAWWGDHGGRRFVIGRHRALVYALSLAIYCTSWTYYGSVGLASTQGFDFLPIYIGPILVVGLGYRLIGRIGDLSRAQNLTTVADFVSARYGKSQAAAALAALIALTASAPYIALQLKSITQTILMVVESFETDRLTPGAPSATFDLAVTFLLAAFAMAFGTRRIDPTEHQDGLILAISVESVVKLIAFLAVGVFVVWGLFGGLEGLMSVAASDPRIAEVMRAPPNPINWLTVTLLSGLAILLLPRQFHVSVVESRDARDIARARWLFPGYLILINLFVAPLAIAGMATFGDGAIDRDLTVLALPLNAGAHLLALTTMLGGLSAATGMVVVDSVALAITVSNDLVMPILLRGRSAQHDLTAAGRDRRTGADGAPARHPRRADARLPLRAVDRRGGAGVDRAVVVRRDRPDRTGLPRRPGVAARHGARRRFRHDGRPGGLVLPAAATVAGRAERARRLPRPRAARPRLAQAGGADRLLQFPAGRRRRGVARPQCAGLRRRLAEPQADAARAHAGDCLRRRDAERQAADLPPVARFDHRRRTRVDGGALSRRRAGAPRLRELPARSRPRADRRRRGRRAPDPPRRAFAVAGDRRLDVATRPVACCCAAAPCRASRRSSCSTTLRRRSSRAATSCSTRSITPVRASRCSTAISR